MKQNTEKSKKPHGLESGAGGSRERAAELGEDHSIRPATRRMNSETLEGALDRRWRGER